jgi:predicted SAM-dependent methyltransferase
MHKQSAAAAALIDDATGAHMRADVDFVHLSNILDWLTPEEAIETLSAAYRSLRRGGLVLIRQLNIFDRLYKELLEIGESA